MWWGYSSALDLLDECELSDVNDRCGDGASSTPRTDEITLNVLLMGQSDNRHVLQTLAKRYQHEEKVKMNFFICESLLENVARDLLFLTLALELPENVGLAEKTTFFMELYGNTLIRPATSNYLASAAQQLLLMITDTDYAQKVLPSLSLDKLKYKERDQLEVIFKYWASNAEPFDILTSWDLRIRKSLGMRYDSKHGAFDWDFHMRYKSFGAETLSMQEYKRFREKGMSFYLEDTDPCIPNRTLASAIITVGSKIINYGYCGDIVTGPYAAFGFNCEDQKMLQKVNGHNKKTATEITQNNVMRLFYEILNNDPFTVNHPEDEPYGLYTVDTSDKLQIKSIPEDNSKIFRKISANHNDYKLLQVENCQIIFLPTTALQNYLIRPAYEDFFDIVTFPQVQVLKYFTPDVVKLVKSGGKIIVDTPKYLLSYRKEDLEKFKCDVENLMKECNCKSLNTSFTYNSDEFLRFKVVK